MKFRLVNVTCEWTLRREVKIFHCPLQHTVHLIFSAEVMLWLAIGPALSEIPFNSSILRARHNIKVLFRSDQRVTLTSMSSPISQKHIFSPELFFSHVCMLPFFACLERDNGDWYSAAAARLWELTTVYSLRRRDPDILKNRKYKDVSPQ